MRWWAPLNGDAPDTTTTVTITTVLAAIAAAIWRFLHLRVPGGDAGATAIPAPDAYGRRLPDLQKAHDDLARDVAVLRVEFTTHVKSSEPVQRDYIERGLRIERLEHDAEREQKLVDRVAASLDNRLQAMDADIRRIGGSK